MVKSILMDDKEIAVPMFSPVCAYCIYYDVDKHRECPAFPGEEIPMEIWLGKNKHTTPHKKQIDDSYVFTKRD